MAYVPRQFITINDSKDMIEINRVFTYLDTFGVPKYRIKMYAPAESFTFDQLNEIFSNDNKINVYEEDDYFSEDIQRLYKITYEHFCKNITIRYSEEYDKWIVEAEKISDIELMAAAHEENTLQALEGIIDLYEMQL